MALIQHWKDEQEEKEMIFWKVEEPLAFFEDQLKLWTIPEVRSEQRKLEFASSRFLLEQLVPDFPIDKLKINDKGKPYFEDESLYFSISHSFPYIGVAVSHRQSIGLDVQTYTDKIQRIQDRFLGVEEQLLVQEDLEKITLFWAGKEAAYKWYGDGFMDFREHMLIKGLREKENGLELSMDFKHPLQQEQLLLQGAMEKEFAWACTEKFDL